jgi:Zn-dependent peptidase ImmA (M78 family)
MTRKSRLFVEVAPDILKWVIKSSGWSNEDLSKKLKLNPNKLLELLDGDIKPTLKQLEDLAKIVKRPLAVFFLAEPPKEKPLPKDYRMLPGKEGKFDKKTILAIRKARRLQKVSNELSENLNASIIKTTLKEQLSNKPKEIAGKYRLDFKFDDIIQKRLKTPYEVFNFLRDIIEDKNIIVFQIPMPVEDARGFTLVDDSPAIIVINSKDQIEARIFTLMHEFGHVLLDESGVSMPENSLFVNDLVNIEKWCNDFSSAFLFPEKVARKEFDFNKNTLTETKTLNKLSRIYKVSKAMLLYNMFRLNFISKIKYDSVLDRFRPEIPKAVDKSKKKGGYRLSADKQCLVERGQKFVSLVAHNIDKGFITHSDALNYLSIKAKILDKVMTKAKK